MSEAPFKVGDLVRLRNPWGPVMTVSEVTETSHPWQNVNCLWFDSASRLQDAVLTSDVLDLVPPA